MRSLIDQSWQSADSIRELRTSNGAKYIASVYRLSELRLRGLARAMGLAGLLACRAAARLGNWPGCSLWLVQWMIVFVCRNMSAFMYDRNTRTTSVV